MKITARAVAAAAFATTALGACGAPGHAGGHPPERASALTHAQGRAAATPASGVAPADDVTSRLAAGNRVLAALTPQDAAHGFILSSSGPDLSGIDSESEIAAGQEITLEAACAGHGGMVVTATSGTATRHAHVSCADGPQRVSFRLTTKAKSIEVRIAADKASDGAAAYVIHKSRY
jgi:hypothetical protein